MEGRFFGATVLWAIFILFIYLLVLFFSRQGLSVAVLGLAL